MSHLHESSKDFDTQSEPWTQDGLWAPDGDEDDEGAGNVNAQGDVDDEGGSEDGGDGDDAQIGSKQKGKAKEVVVDFRPKKHVKVPEKNSMGPCPGKSTPAPTQKKTTKSAIDKFSDIAAKEEETTQKVIELKRTKLKAYADKEIAKVKSKAEIKMNQDRLCAELEMKKMEYEYQFKLAATQPGGPPQSLPSLPQLPDPSNETRSHIFGKHSTNSDLLNSFTSGGHWNEAAAGRSSTSRSDPSHQTFTERLQNDSMDYNFSDLSY